MLDDVSRLRLLHEVGCALAARLELDELIPLVVAKCREVLEAQGAAVLLLDADRRELHFPYVDEEDHEVAESLAGLRFPADRGIAGLVLQSGEAIRVDDVSTDTRFYPDVDRHTGLTTRSVISAPLSSRHGPIGLIEVVNHRGGSPFTDADLTFLSSLAGSVAVAVENARLWAQLKDSADRLRSQVGALRRDLARRERFDDMIGSGPLMEEVFRLMESAAASPIAVLIEGETGTGKELVARGIHRASARGSEPFVAVNCGAVPEALLESELFGYRRGAFTGAVQDQRGLFEAASGGTIFLDEIGDMAPAMQVKLLRVLQEGEVTPVGDRHPRKVDLRVISATNRDLRAEMEHGRFREDLYFRIGAFPIHVPPLRERRSDIHGLADLCLARAAERHAKRIPGIDAAALERIASFGWPGNVRELQNELERAVALARDGEPIGLAHLSERLRGCTPGDAGAVRGAPDAREAVSSPQSSSDLRVNRAQFEASFISKVLRTHGGNVTRAAEALGISRVALQKKMKDFGLR